LAINKKDTNLENPLILTPVSVLDNFFDNPDSVRQWALQQEYFSDPTGKWPGKRSKQLIDLHPGFFHFLSNRYFNMFFNLEYETMNWHIEAMFQLVDKDYKSGWVHDDSGSQITGIIYLSPNASIQGGTSIYRRKSDVVFSIPGTEEIKCSAYQGKTSIESVEQQRLADSEIYEETIRVGNVYNRLVSFDSHLHHGAQDFFGEGEEARLTLVFFVRKLMVNKTPVMRVKTTV